MFKWEKHGGGVKEFSTLEPWLEMDNGEAIKRKITMQHGNMLSGIARGSTPNPIHLTELPDYKNPASIVEGSMFNAIHENEFTFVILESTASGADDWWHRFWKENIEFWPEGISRWRPLFLPWYLGTDIWPTPFWVEQRRELLSRYQPNDKTIAHAERARQYVRSTPLLSSILGSTWEMPIEQMMYWQFSRELAIKKKTVKNWLQEVGAADPDECFQSGGEGVIPYEIITDLLSTSSPSFDTYTIKAEEIPERLSFVNRTLIDKE
jgi:hypothetical protein